MGESRQAKTKFFEVGKFYAHEAGRQIAVVGEVDTTRWGKMFVIEEADKTGHAISCVEINKTADVEKHGWVEIGNEEWLRNFVNSTCWDCGAVFKDGDKFVPTNNGPIHIECYAQKIKEGGPENIIELMPPHAQN